MRFQLLLVFVATTLIAIPALSKNQKRHITETDLFNFVWAADPQVSPDGSRVAFVRVTVNEEKDGYNTAIWSVSLATGESHPLTFGRKDSTPRWSPDGKFLAFVRVTNEDGRDNFPQLFMLPLTSGDYFQVTTITRGASNPEWSPDGKKIAFINDANIDDLAKQRDALKQTASPSSSKTENKKNEAHESDVLVITQAVFRKNEDGYLDPKRKKHIWVVDVPKNGDDKVVPKQLSRGNHNDVNIVWAKDSSRIYFVSHNSDASCDEFSNTDIYSVSLTKSTPVKLTSFAMGGSGFSISPDGLSMAFYASITQPVQSYSEPDLWIMDIAPNAKPRNLTRDFDYDLGSTIIGDNIAPRAGVAPMPIWSGDGKSIIALYSKEGRANLAAFDTITGKATDVTVGNHAIVAYHANQSTSKLALIISTPTRIGDIFWLDGIGTKPRQLTHYNDELFNKLILTDPEEIWYQSFDGKRIHAWIQKPPNFNKKKKYPLILNIHGGPHLAYGFIFDHEFLWMAAKGYVVLYTNPRGSTTYGQNFGNIIQYNYPGDDYKDLMAGVDEVIKRGHINDKKLGITGGSGGGLLTNWAIGHTTRFKAAVSQRDVASWADWWYTTDCALFRPTWFKAPPFEAPEDFKSHSPITYIKNVTTPLMLIVSDNDYRAPPGAGGEAMFRALQYRKIPTVMVRFPNETHELSRSGQPWHRIERLKHLVGWFDHWLMGIEKPEYAKAKLPVDNE